MGTKNKKVVEEAGYSLDDLLTDNQTFNLKFAFLELTLRLLNRADMQFAETAARVPGRDPKKPGQDDDMYADALLSRCVKGWRHRAGGKLMSGGVEFKCTPKNITIVADKTPGLATFIFSHVKNSDLMYNTVKEQELKN